MRAHLLFSDLYRRYRHILPQLMSPEPSKGLFIVLLAANWKNLPGSGN
jgi:hypothetical protein